MCLLTMYLLGTRYQPRSRAGHRGVHIVMPGAGQQLALGDEEQIDDRLARRAHELEGRLAKLGTAGITKPKDLLEFVNNLKHKTVGGQQLTADCMFCGVQIIRQIISTGATRVVEHFRDKCLACPSVVKEGCNILRDAAERKRKEKEQHTALVVAEQEHAVVAVKAQKTEMKQQGLKAGFGAAEVTVADQAIARFFYANAVSFDAADSSPDSYYREMVRTL